MKHVLITSLMSFAGVCVGSGQVLGSFDFHGADQTNSGALQTNPALAESLKPTYVADHCINVSAITPSSGYTPNPRTWSTNTYDSSTTSGPTSAGGNGLSGNHADCFGGWSSSYSSSRLIEFDLTLDAQAVGQVSGVKLDIGNYGYSDDPSLFRFNVLKNGTLVYTDTRKITSKWVNQAFDLSGANLTSSVGSTDVFSFQIGAYGKGTSKYGLIALDNIDILGKHECVPEPTSVALLGLGSLGMLLRRRR